MGIRVHHCRLSFKLDSLPRKKTKYSCQFQVQLVFQPVRTLTKLIHRPWTGSVIFRSVDSTKMRWPRKQIYILAISNTVRNTFPRFSAFLQSFFFSSEFSLRTLLRYFYFWNSFLESPTRQEFYISDLSLMIEGYYVILWLLIFFNWNIHKFCLN